MVTTLGCLLLMPMVEDLMVVVVVQAACSLSTAAWAAAWEAAVLGASAGAWTRPARRAKAIGQVA